MQTLPTLSALGRRLQCVLSRTQKSVSVCEYVRTDLHQLSTQFALSTPLVLLDDLDRLAL